LSSSSSFVDINSKIEFEYLVVLNFQIIGGITSYLIILIQFNMAAEQVKTGKAINNAVEIIGSTNATQFEQQSYTAASTNYSAFLDIFINWPQYATHL